MVGESDAAIWVRRTLIFIALVSLIRLFLLPALPLTPQDAYYWQYSQHLSLGYFDHPPMHAYTAWLTTAIFGDNSFGIRLGPWLYGVGLLFLCFALARRIWNERVGFWTVVAAGVTPLFSIGSSILTPDPPLLFFWTLSVYFGYRALSEDKGLFWLLAGFAGGLAMLSKYTACFLGLGFLLILLFTERGRKHLRTPWPYLGLLTAFITFLPQFIWNAQHNWASFAYQTTRRADEISRWRLDLFGGMLGSQIAIVSPLLFGGILWTAFHAGWQVVENVLVPSRGTGNHNNHYHWPATFLTAFTIPIILFFTLVALRYWVKMNWLAPAYVTGALAFVGLVMSKKPRRIPKILKWAVAIAAVETVALYIIVLFPIIPLTGEVAYWQGWNALAERIETEREDMPEGTFVAGWGYKVPSELSFYLDDRPQTHSAEIFGLNGLNYNYWTDTEKLVGRDCIFVADKREPFKRPELLEGHFIRVEEQPKLEIFSNGKKATVFRIWRCFDYLGP